MYSEAIAKTRAQLQGLVRSLGEGALLAQVARLETLSEMIQRALTDVSGHTGSLAEFYDVLVQLRSFLESARETLRILEKENDELHFSREASDEGWTVVRTLFRTVSQDLDDLVWCLPFEAPQRRRMTRPLSLAAPRGSNQSSTGD